MKAALTYSENSFDIVNYVEISSLKSIVDSQPSMMFKQVYLDIENSKQTVPYITINMSDALTTNSFHEIKTKNTITIYDEISKFYYIGSITNAIYVNNITCRIEFQVLPIQTNIINGINRDYDCCYVKTPIKPTYNNNIAQSIVGETVTSVNYNSAISAGISDFQIISKIMLVINKDLSPLGLVNKGYGGIIPNGEIILDNPLSACATKVGGSTVPGFVQFFDNDASLQRFIQSCYDADIKVLAKVFGEDGKTYQMPKTGTENSPSGGVFTLFAKREDLMPDALIRGAAVIDADRVDKYYIPESINPSNFIMCKELPFQVCSSEIPVSVGVNLPIVINSEPYFNLSSLLQIKCISSSGQSLVLDGNNILFNDGNPSNGFNCSLVASLSGLDLYIGESSYVLNICKFPDVSYSGNSFENYNTVMARTGILSKITTTVTNGLSNAVDEWYNTFKSGFTSNEGVSAKTYEAIPLDKTSVIGSISSSAWTTAKFHIETTYLPSGVKSRLNAVYDRFGYDDYRFVKTNILNMTSGFWQASQIQEVNDGNLNAVTFINSSISDGIKQQLLSGVYVKK